MKREKLELFVLTALALALGGGLAFAFVKYLLPLLLPFFIAAAVAMTVRAPADKISAKTHISPRVLRPVIAILGALLSLLLLVFLSLSLGRLLCGMLSDITSGGSYSAPSGLFELPAFLKGLQDAGGVGIAELMGTAMEDLLGSCISLLAKGAVRLPDMLLSALVTLVAAVYFSIDIDRISAWIKSFLPEKYQNKISKLKTKILGILFKYVKSYLQIMLITFAIMLVGLLILGVESAVLSALFIALFDILPLIGVGAVLLPSSLLSFAVGDAARGVGFIVLFLVYTVVRESLEPKIFGKSLDVHPLVTLISVYVGYGLFGLTGLVVFPVCAVLLLGSRKKDKPAEVG